MKKYNSVILTAGIAVFCLSVCGASTAVKASESSQGQGETLQIVTTIFPEYDWITELLGDQADCAEVTMLLDKSIDLHSYQPSAEDILKIAECDLFVYVGGESDEWAGDVLQEHENPNRKVINLLEILGDLAKEEELAEGMEEEPEEGDEEETEYDEHVWLSLKNAQVICEVLADTLSELDPENAADYQVNAETYGEALAALDEEYQAVVDDAEQRTLLFGDTASRFVI